MCNPNDFDECDVCMDDRYDAMEAAVKKGMLKFFTELNVALYPWEVTSSDISDHLRKDRFDEYLDDYIRAFEWREK